MAELLRPRLDATVKFEDDDNLYEVQTRLKDAIKLKEYRKGKVTGDGEDTALMVYFAMKRNNQFDGTWDQFIDAVEDMVIVEAPPLGGQTPSRDSLQLSQESPE